MKLVLPAEPASVPKLRHRVSRFAEDLGLGLSIIARLAGDLRIVQEGDGTEVRMRFPLPG